MKLTLSNGHNPNYVATVVELKVIRKHKNADRLAIANIFGNSVVVDIKAKVGDVGVFFPLESQLSDAFLHEHSQYKDKTKNKDENKSNFFEEKRRVKAVSFRGEKSEGFFIPIEGITKDMVNTNFDTIDGELIVNKYIIPPREQSQSTKVKGDKKVVKRFDRLVENQFRLHVDTSQLKKNIFKLELDDYIGVHYKKHGTSWVVSNCLVKRPLGTLEKIAQFFGVPVDETEYDIVYSSRKVVKNQYINKDQKNSYYSFDLWKDIAYNIGSIIPKGWTIYGEAVGFLPDGGAIQRDFDYGCEPNTYKTYVYRITTTNRDGVVFELDDKQIEEWCERNGLLYKDTFIFYGTVKEHVLGLLAGKAGMVIDGVDTHIKDILPAITHNDVDLWRKVYLELLIEKYNEKDCYMCKNVVPEEGIIIRKQKLFDYEAFKLKSFRFLQKESRDLDEDAPDMESLN